MRALNRKRVPLSSSMAFVLPLVLAAGIARDAGSPALASTGTTAAVIPVGNCNDDGPGSLRAAIASAASGDTINLRPLECRRIVLTGAIEIPQDDLTLLGPTRALLVDGNRAGQVFVHPGTGTLRIRAMSIGYGLNEGVVIRGGCIESGGKVRLEYVRIHHCMVDAHGSLEPNGFGGAVYSFSAEVYDSTIDFNTVVSGSDGEGGGISAAYVLLVRSRVHGNTAGTSGGGIETGTLRMYHSEVTANSATSGGGIDAGGGNITVAYSTIANNHARANGGGAILEVDSSPGETDRLLIMNSTISGNSALYSGGLELTGRSEDMSLINSTIAFNRERTELEHLCRGGLEIVGPLLLESTIVARNTCINRRLDIGSDPQFAEIVGADNLVGVSTVPLPPDTISAEPRISPLADNGGRTRTHALWAGSPAVDMGNNHAALEFDQRGRGFPRVKGGRADIGAYER